MERELFAIFSGAPFVFEDLAVRVFTRQFERCEPYRRFCTVRGATPATIVDWREIPHLPATAFKHAQIYSGLGQPSHFFQTSGSSDERRGRHYFERLDLYAACSKPVFRHMVMPDVDRMPMLMLAQPPAQRPDSSLSWYLDQQEQAFGAPGGGWFVDQDGLQVNRLAAAVTQIDGPVALLGTAFSFVHLIESGFKTRLAPGSRVMETGGFKGKSRAIEREDLYSELRAALGPDLVCLNQYGMTELSSNCYDQTLSSSGRTQRKAGPDWMRVRILDPETLAEVEPGEPGLIAVTDLANLYSCAFLLTQDLGVGHPDGFEVLGRAPGAESRGCSIALDQFLQGNRL